MNTITSLVDTVAAKSDQRRIYRRFDLRVAILVHPMSVGLPEYSATRRAAFTGDVSLSGLRFESRIGYTVGRLVSIHFTIGVKPYKVTACVKRSRPVRVKGRLRYECAVQFVHGDDINVFIPALAKYLARKGALKEC